MKNFKKACIVVALFFVTILVVMIICLPTSAKASVYADKMEWYEDNYNPLANEVVAEDVAYIDDSRLRIAGTHDEVIAMWYHWNKIDALQDIGVTGFIAEYNFYYGDEKVTEYLITNYNKDDTLQLGWDVIYVVYDDNRFQPFAVIDGSGNTVSMYSPFTNGGNMVYMGD